MVVFTVEDINNVWCCERVLELMEDARNNDARAIAQEWGHAWDELEEAS